MVGHHTAPRPDEGARTGRLSLESDPPHAAQLLPNRWAILVFIEGPTAGATLSLGPEDSLVFGRGLSSQVCIPEESLSEEHAKISWDGSGYALEPLSGRVWVDGALVVHAIPLTSGARIQLGRAVRLRFDLYDQREQELITGLFRAALRDWLTGAHTRQYLDERLPAELSFAARHSTSMALLMIDIDGFKQINDRFGHPAGDAVLRIVAAQLRRSLRPEDVLTRYGGDEFCVLLRELDLTHASLLAQRVLRAVAGLRIPLAREVVQVTLSIGAATVDPARPPTDGAQLLARADSALYRAKREGRNRCCCAPAQPDQDAPGGT